MRFISYPTTDAYENIATDAWLLDQLRADEPVYALWQNRDAIIVGRNQNTLSEINQQFVEKEKIQVVRRVTGGGAVYHDLGNINFTFIVPLASSAGVDFKTFVQPMVTALANLGIEVEVSGRNDLTIEGRKISGNAQRYANGYLMHHGTLLFKPNVERMVEALNVSDEKFISKAAKSVRSRVGMISNYVDDSVTIPDLIVSLKKELSAGDPDLELSPEQKQAIQTLKQNRFETWDWNYGESPNFNYHNHAKITGGAIDVFAEVEQDLVKEILFEGDFLALYDWREIVDQLIGKPFEAIPKILSEPSFQIDRYFGGITADELTSLFRPNAD